MATVREARAEDAFELAGVHVRSWQAAYRGLLPDDYLDNLRPEDRAPHYDFGSTSRGVPVTIIAEQNDIICGFAIFGRSREDAAVGEIYAIYADPDWWSRGVGRLLMTSARSRLSELGLTEVVLWVLVGNKRAERFYRADGWSPDGSHRTEEVWDVRVNEIRYRRPLP